MADTNRPKLSTERTYMAKKMTKKTLKSGARKPARKPMYPRAAANVYRQGSSYGTAFDILFAHPAGLPRQKLAELLARATGKSVKRAGFDVAVVISPSTASPTAARHRSCREGYGIERENDHVLLRLPPTK
jgi:hypothetical protein